VFEKLLTKIVDLIFRVVLHTKLHKTITVRRTASSV